VPVASATIGRVQRARRLDGTPVAVKVRHQDIDEAVRADFRAAAIGKAMGSLIAPSADVGHGAATLNSSQTFQTKRDVLNLRLRGKLLFLFRIRFGLYTVLG
jgi:hypothetical protein